MKTELDYMVLECMSVYGGSFVKQLAILAQRADSVNFAKIKSTWPDYWAEYEVMAKQRFVEKE